MEIAELETLLNDKPEAVALVKSLAERASRLTPELEADLPKLGEFKAAHAGLTKILETSKAKDAASLVNDWTALVSAKTDLERWKAEHKANGGTKTPEYLALEEQLAAVNTALKAVQDQAAADKAARAEAEKSSRAASLRASVVDAGAKHKIAKVDDQFLLLSAKGLVGHKDDGSPFFHKLNDKGEKVAVRDADELMAWLATDKANVQGSGTGGAGGTHAGGGAQPEGPKNRYEAKAALRDAFQAAPAV